MKGGRAPPRPLDPRLKGACVCVGGGGGCTYAHTIDVIIHNICYMLDIVAMDSIIVCTTLHIVATDGMFKKLYFLQNNVVYHVMNLHKY